MKITPNFDVHAQDEDGKRVVYPANQEVELPTKVAQDLIDRGFATESKATSKKKAADESTSEKPAEE